MTILDDYIIDVLMRDLVGHDRRPVSFLVYLWMAAEQQRRKTAVQISYQELAESVGVSKSSVQAAVGWLVRRKLLAAAKKMQRPRLATQCSVRGEMPPAAVVGVITEVVLVMAAMGLRVSEP